MRRASDVATPVATFLLLVGAAPERASVGVDSVRLMPSMEETVLLAPASEVATNVTPDAKAATERGGWISLSLLGGSTQHDPALEDYQWDVRLRPAWGAEALAGWERWAGGLRLWRTRSRQNIDGSDPEGGPAVNGTSLEAVGRARLGSFHGIDVHAIAGAGLLHLAYDPDRVEIQTGGTPIVVDLAPVDTWIGGAGLGFQRALGQGWQAGLELDQRWFAMDAAHRDGDAIEVRRERFRDWSARLELGRRWGSR
jgi:hypothetical protein